MKDQPIAFALIPSKVSQPTKLSRHCLRATAEGMVKFGVEEENKVSLAEERTFCAQVSEDPKTQQEEMQMASCDFEIGPSRSREGEYSILALNCGTILKPSTAYLDRARSRA